MLKYITVNIFNKYQTMFVLLELCCFVFYQSRTKLSNFVAKKIIFDYIIHIIFKRRKLINAIMIEQQANSYNYSNISGSYREKCKIGTSSF